MSAPAVAVAPDGTKFVAAWKDLRMGRNEPGVYWAVSDNPNSFQDSPICAVLRPKQDHPAVALDSHNRVWAVWEDSRTGSRAIWARTPSSSDSGHAISDASDGVASFPAIAANHRGAAVVYEAKRGTESIMFRWLDAAPR